MGVLISLFANRKRNKIIISEVKEGNASLANRVKRLSQENSLLKSELHLITDSRIRSQAPVPKRKFGTPSLPHCTEET